MEEAERTVVSIDSASEVVTVASSSEGSVFAPPEAKRPKAVAKPRPKLLIRNKGRGKGGITQVDAEDPPEVTEVPAAPDANSFGVGIQMGLVSLKFQW